MKDRITQLLSNNPTPEEIKEARAQTGLSQQDCASLVFKCLRAWKNWESGEAKMDRAIYEYFLMVTSV